MSGDERTEDAVTHLVLEAKRGYMNRVNDVRVVAARANKPNKLTKDQVAIKVTFRVPTNLFEPIAPEAVIEIPQGHALQGPLQIIAGVESRPNGVLVTYDEDSSQYTVTTPDQGEN